MTPTRRNRRRSAARRLGLPEIPRPAAPAAAIPGPVRPGTGTTLCCSSTRTRQVLPGGAVVITRHHSADCPVWSAR